MSTIGQALKEASVDTAVALPLNMVINWFILLVAFEQEWGATITTIVATVIFSIIAIARKTYIRMHFSKRYNSGS